VWGAEDLGAGGAGAVMVRVGVLDVDVHPPVAEVGAVQLLGQVGLDEHDPVAEAHGGVPDAAALVASHLHKDGVECALQECDSGIDVAVCQGGMGAHHAADWTA
jgi:hypothetical protein